MMQKEIVTLLAAFALLLVTPSIHAGSATWKLNPGNGDWNTATNWTPNTVPSGPSDAATFAASNTTNVSLSANTEVSGVVFNPGASAFTISPNPGTTLTISGAGITNNSGTTQNFVCSADTNFNHGFLVFSNNATAGSNTTITNKVAVGALTYGGETNFDGNSNAGSATVICEGSAAGRAGIVGGVVAIEENASAGYGTFITGGGTTVNSNGGEVALIGTATAGNGTFINNPATALRAQGGFVEMLGGSGGDAIFINNGSAVPGAGGGVTAFYPGSHADNCTLVANGGTNGGRGGEIWFYVDSFGGTPRVQVFGNGFLDTSNSNVTIGSLEGDGDVVVGTLPLAIGTNNLDTIFSGKIKDGKFGGGGSVRKVGTGRFVLTGGSSYTGGATIEQGRLEVSNLGGSGTGTGPVRVRGGRLAGQGAIAGPVTVGTGGGGRAVLAPGRTPSKPQTLTIQSALTFNSDATYICDWDSNTVAADKVIANGITIDGAAIFAFADSGATILAPGTVVTVIDNTAATAIAGTFSNLANGTTVTVGNNTFQANYEGGDGNDLTLAVVP